VNKAVSAAETPYFGLRQLMKLVLDPQLLPFEHLDKHDVGRGAIALFLDCLIKFVMTRL
jgi:hypothetical protein